jgi:uncharacterized membrane protein YtjA (UPF0391 family)
MTGQQESGCLRKADEAVFCSPGDPFEKQRPESEERNSRSTEALISQHRQPKEMNMLGWALTFLVIALIAAALGFGGVAGTAAGIAQIIFYIFLVLLVVSLVMHFVRGTAP